MTPSQRSGGGNLGFPIDLTLPSHKPSTMRFAGLQQAGAEVIHLSASADLTLDAVYTHDASIPTDCGLIPMNPGKASRVPEARHHLDLCKGLGIPMLGAVSAPGTSEAGDTVWLDRKPFWSAAGIGRMLRGSAGCARCCNREVSRC